MKATFSQLARISAEALGSSAAPLLGIGVMAAAAATGFYYDYSDTRQPVMNTATSIGPILIVFLIQNMQNRDGGAIQLKLDELIRAVKPTMRPVTATGSRNPGTIGPSSLKS
jgi:low affinity Fe/Cu permease